MAMIMAQTNYKITKNIQFFKKKNIYLYLFMHACDQANLQSEFSPTMWIPEVLNSVLFWSGISLAHCVAYVLKKPAVEHML